MTKRLLAFVLVASVAAWGAIPARAATRLRATVGPGLTISLSNAAGQRVTRLKAGNYVIVVVDRSKTDNFHLKGAGINTIDRKTGVAFAGTATWRVRLLKGKHTYRSDAHPSSMKATFIVI